MSEMPDTTQSADAGKPAAPAIQEVPTQGGDYKVELDVYSGPLELLLYLIRRDEVDIRNIPIARITEQYLQHVEIIRRIDINLAGEFLVMAATLLEIKSRMLIPQQKVLGPEGEGGGGASSVEELADPRYELVKQLLAYKEFKDAAGELKRRAETEADRFGRGVARREGRAPLEIEDLDLFRLIDAFNAIMASVGHSAYGHEVLYDDTPISLHQADILDRLAREMNEAGVTIDQAKGLTLRELFEGRKTKSEMIGVFLATLELIRQKKIIFEQEQVEGGIGEVRIRLREGGEMETPSPQDPEKEPEAGIVAAESPGETIESQVEDLEEEDGEDEEGNEDEDPGEPPADCEQKPIP